MEEKQKVQESTVHSVLKLYGLDSAFGDQKEYISYIGERGDGLIKIVMSVLLKSGKRVVIKILHEENDLIKDRDKIEKQSAFSAFIRLNGIETPMRYMANGRFCNEYIYNGIPCNVTIEDWCGEEITEINTDISYKIGKLMARMHTISLENKCEIGCGTLFSAAYWNDVDAYESFCRIGENKNLDQSIVSEIKRSHDEKLNKIRDVWDKLPRAAVQGDISINNLVLADDDLIVFDYNNAGDEVLISDLVMEGLLTAYEMDLPQKADKSMRDTLFPAFLSGYLSARKLSKEEADTAWLVYTLYHALWFTRVVYNEDSLEKLTAKEAYAAANRLLMQMLSDITESDDGRFAISE